MSEIYDYEGNLLGGLELGKHEYIDSLSWTGSRQLTVEIRSDTSETPILPDLEIPLEQNQKGD